MKREACIIAGRRFGDALCLLKNRDRAYDAELEIIHFERRGNEIAVIFDTVTGYLEGVNEHGIAVVNTTLMVVRDEAEGKKKGPKKKAPLKSKDGPKILRALACNTIEDAVESLRTDNGGIRGHTFVADGNKLFSIECSKNHPARVTELDATKVNTRTNHGVNYPDAGYTHGEDYVSSIVRRWEAQKRLQNVKLPESAAVSLVDAVAEADSPFNPVRVTDKMRTTTQLTIDTTNPRMLLYLIPGHAKVVRKRNLLPDGREPKIPVRVFQYKNRMEDRSPDMGKSAKTHVDRIPGGLADKKKPQDFDPDQLKKGIKVEMEHTEDPAKAEEIAMDHLTEDPKYYDKLEKIEKHGARYKSKKKVKTKDGDEMTVYEYSDRQVADRNRKKAERVEKLRKQMKKLQTKVRSDVNSDDEKTRDLALAVGLMDETFERIGNDGSAKEGHFGVTTWRVKHVKFSKGSATITYVGKSGVDQKKKITNSRIVSALKKACKDKKPEDCVLNVSASEVNTYLKPLDITAKDIRGFHANREMKDQLRKVRKGKLPEDKKERDKKLKDEFKKALEETAKSVGHEPSTLRSQYLVPGLEDDYMKDGTISESHTRKAADLAKVAASGTDFERKILAHARVAPTFVGQDRRWWLKNAPNIYRVARENERARPYIEGLRFPPEMFAVIWYEGSDGEYLGEPNYYADSPPEGPEGAKYMYSRFPTQLSETTYLLKEDGSSEPVMGWNSTFPSDLVTEMVRCGEWDAADAIMVAGQSCSRCLNVLCNRYLGEEEGFPFDSEEYWEHGTECRMCRHIQNPNQKKATPSYEDYVQRKRREGGRPLPRDRWEALVMGGSPEEDPPSREDWNERRKSMVERHGLDKFYTGYSPDNRHLSVDLISVPKDRRGQGGATAAMKETLDWADQNGVTVTLSPTSEFGASKKRLEKWYAGMGFVPNKGRNKDFRFTDSMLRTPQTRTATKSEAERDDEDVERMLRKEPKKKPPRYDLRDNRTLDEEEEDNLGGGDKGDRDLSMKWNKVASRVAFRWSASVSGPSALRVAMLHVAKDSFDDWAKDQTFRHPDTNNEVGFASLPADEQKRIRDKWKGSQKSEEDGDGKQKSKGEEDKSKERTREDVQVDLDNARDEVAEIQDDIDNGMERVKSLKSVLKDQKKLLDDVQDQAKAQVSEKISDTKKEIRKLENEIDDKKDDLAEAKDRVKELKAERKDPGFAKAKREEKIKKDRARRIEKAVTRAQDDVEDLLGKGSGIPSKFRSEVADSLNALDDDQVETFSMKFQGRLKELMSQDPGSDAAIQGAVRAAKFGDLYGLDDPEDIADRLAQLSYAMNVVANPMTIGGKPVGVTEMDPDIYKERAEAAFKQFQKLPSSLRRGAAAKVERDLEGLDPETNRAQELNAILTGMNVAHVAATGDSLPSRPQPSKGAAQIIKNLVNQGRSSELFQLSEDYFAEQARAQMQGRLDDMDAMEVANIATNGDPNHPYADIGNLLSDEATPAVFQVAMKDFLIQDILNDQWGDRAIRDTMEGAGIVDADDPDVRAEIQAESKGNTKSRLEGLMMAQERAAQAEAQGQAPDAEDLKTIQDFYQGESEEKPQWGPDGMSGFLERAKSGKGAYGPRSGLRENVRSLLETLKDKFNKIVVSPATAVLNNFVQTGDSAALGLETAPHPDENAKEPRPRTERRQDQSQSQESSEPGDEEHGAGDVWRTDQGNWRAKNRDGRPKSFKSKDEAQRYSQGPQREGEESADQDESYFFEGVDVEERGPTKFASVADSWLRKMLSSHPDDPARPLLVLNLQ